MRYWLDWGNRRYAKRSSSVKLAFETWAGEVFERKRQLREMSLAEILERDHRN